MPRKHPPGLPYNLIFRICHVKNRKSYIRQLFGVYCREFKLVIHDPGILIFFIFLPIVYPVIYSLIYNPEVVRDVKMVVVDNDRSAKVVNW